RRLSVPTGARPLDPDPDADREGWPRRSGQGPEHRRRCLPHQAVRLRRAPGADSRAAPAVAQREAGGAPSQRSDAGSGEPPGDPRGRSGRADLERIRDPRGADAKRRRNREPNAPGRTGVERGIGSARQSCRRKSEPSQKEDRLRRPNTADSHDPRLWLPPGARAADGGMRPLSFKTRLWLGHVGVLAVLLTLTAFGADWAFRRVVLGRIIDDSILWLASTEAATIQADPRRVAPIHDTAPGAGPPSFPRLDKFVQITDLDGQVTARSVTLGTARLPTPPDLLAHLRGGEAVFATHTEFGEEPIRMVSLPLQVGPARFAVQVARSLDDASAATRAGRWLFLTMALVILTAVGLTSALLANSALRPIDQMVRRARDIGEANLSERLPHPGTADEIGRLVETLNDMPGRLDRSFDAQRRFTPAASPRR